MEVIEGIAKEQSDDCAKEDFIELYHQALQDEDHGFICIDFHPKQHRFRKGFDQYIPFPGDPALKGTKKRCLPQPHPPNSQPPQQQTQVRATRQAKA